MSKRTTAHQSSGGTVRAENGVDGQTVEGHVLSIEGADVIVHFAGPERVAEGDVVELWRSIELVHPVTRKRVRDRYRVRFWSRMDLAATNSFTVSPAIEATS